MSQQYDSYYMSSFNNLQNLQLCKTKSPFAINDSRIKHLFKQIPFEKR